MHHLLRITHCILRKEIVTTRYTCLLSFFLSLRFIFADSTPMTSSPCLFHIYPITQISLFHVFPSHLSLFSLPLMLRSEVVMKVQPQTVILDAMREHTKLNLYDNDSIVDDKGQ
eukprot:m.61482 g.61482  ORF g.61482 m.61482 type:complete len:114 (-) comp11867_c0_seq4:170-511(-)